MILTADMEKADRAHVSLGLTSEQKPVFDLLMREDLSKQDIKQIKNASVELLQAIEERIRSVQGIFQKESTRDGLRSTIYDLLYDEQTGLPADKFDDDALAVKTEQIFCYFEAQMHVAA